MPPEQKGDAWANPGITRIEGGLYRLPLPIPSQGLRAINVYIIESEHGWVVVDGGWRTADSRNALEDGLRGLGSSSSEIKEFLVTHMHADHYTQAVAIRREHGARVSLGVGEQDAIRNLLAPDATGLMVQLEVLREAGAGEVARRVVENGLDGEPTPGDWEPPDRWLQGRCEFVVGGRRLRAIPTPGHTNGHYVFADANAKLLFSGDHVLPHITPSIGFQPQRVHGALQQFLDSLELMLNEPDMRLLPAHGPVTASVHERVKELLSHHRNRLSECEDAVISGKRTAFEVAMTIPWTRRRHPFARLDAFNQMLAVIETAAHLEVLAAEGRVGSWDLDGTTHYAAP